MGLLKEKKESLADVEKRMLELHEKAKTEKRSLTDEEKKEWQGMVDKRNNIQLEIAQEETIQSILKRQAEPTPQTKDEKKILAEFRFHDVIKASLEFREKGKLPEGLVAEMSQEAEREAKLAGQTIKGIGIPYMVLRSARPNANNMINFEKRANQVVGTESAGGYTVPTELVGFIDALYAKLKLVSLGAQKLTGLTGKIDMPTGENNMVTVWEGEVDDNVVSNKTFGKKSIEAHRLSAFTPMSKQLIIQSSLDIENYIREQLLTATSIAVETAAINGAGSTDPLGLLGTSGIGSVVGDTNGAVPAWSHIVDLETAIYSADADVEGMGYLTTPGIKGVLKKTAIESGDATKIWPVGSKELNGYRAEVSTLVPSDLTKGTSTNCHAIMFGNFKDLVMCQWGGLDILVDPYSSKYQGLVEVQLDSFHDIFVKRAKSFAAMVDALTA